jgi:hypothetical protein
MSLPEPKNRVLQKAPPILRALRLIFTFAFLFLWFKGNFAQFKKIQVGV